MCFSWDGSEILASYSGDAIYLFDTNASPVTQNTSTTTTTTANPTVPEKRKHPDREVFNRMRKRILGVDYDEEDTDRSEDDKEAEEVDGTIKRKYVGHLNTETVKEVSFYGPKSEYICSGKKIFDKNTIESICPIRI